MPAAARSPAPPTTARSSSAAPARRASTTPSVTPRPSSTATSRPAPKPAVPGPVLKPAPKADSKAAASKSVPPPKTPPGPSPAASEKPSQTVTPIITPAPKPQPAPKPVVRPLPLQSRFITTPDGKRFFITRTGQMVELPPEMSVIEVIRIEMEALAAEKLLAAREAEKKAPDEKKGEKEEKKEGEKEENKKKKDKPGAKDKKGPPGKGKGSGKPGAAVAPFRIPGASPVVQYLTAKTQGAVRRGLSMLKRLRKNEQTHDDAPEKLKQSEKAVVIPPSEGQAKSNSKQVNALGDKPTPQADETRSKIELQQSLAENSPRTIEDVDSFKRDRKGQHISADVLKVVQVDKNAVITTFNEIGKTPPPVPPEREPEEIPGEEAAPGTPIMNLGRGVIVPLQKEHTDVSRFTNEADRKLEESGISQEQLDMVDSGDLAEANKEKKGMEQTARTEPFVIQHFVQQESVKVDQDLKQEEKHDRDIIKAKRKTSFATTGKKQRSTKTDLEKKREEVSSKINGIYSAAQTKVTKRLADLETLSMKRFDAGNAKAAKDFEDNVNREIDAFKDDRYSGFFGWARRAKDWLLGIDDLPEVKAIFERNRALFVRTINKLVEEITADNKKVIQECKEEIANAKQKIKEFVDQLGPDLKSIGVKAAQEMDSKLDELDRTVAQKEQQLQDKLKQKQQDAIKAIDQKIEKMKEAMSGALAKLGRLLLWAAKKFFTWALKKFGYSLGEIESIIDKGVAVLKAIFTQPIRFVKNLVSAASSGFKNFGKNFLTHLKDAVFDWLTGSLEGIRLPGTWDLKGIASVAFQLLGLTWQDIRPKLVTAIGEPAVNSMQESFEVVTKLVKDGPIAAWDALSDMAGEIKKAFVESIQDFIKIKIVQEAIKTVVAIFIPGAGIIRAIIAIYDTIVFFIQKAKQILEMIGNFLSSIGEIAMGNIGAAAAALEKGLATALKLVINFLARFLRLSGVTSKIRGAIQKLRAKTGGMIDKVVKWIVAKARRAGRATSKALGIGQDKRSHAEKQRDLQAAVAVVQRINPERRSRILLTPALALIKRRYRLTDLSIAREAAGGVTIRAAVNPEMLFDLPRLTVEAKPHRWISKRLLHESRTQLRLLREHDTIERVRAILTRAFTLIKGLPPGSRLEVDAESEGSGTVYVHLGGASPQRILVGRVIPPNAGFRKIRNPEPGGVADCARHIRTKMVVVKDARGHYLGPKVIRDLSPADARRIAARQGLLPRAPGSRATILQHTEGVGSAYISTSRINREERMRSGTFNAAEGRHEEFFDPASGRVEINLFLIESSRIHDLSNRVAQEFWAIFAEAPGPSQEQAMLDTIRTMEVLIKGEIPFNAVRFLDLQPTRPPRDDVAPWP